jgi:hypothetical protein
MDEQIVGIVRKADLETIAGVAKKHGVNKLSPTSARGY